VRYVIFGAGAIGGTIAARLALGGFDVVAIARGGHLAALRRGGLRFATPEGRWQVELDAVGAARDVDWRDDDAVLLTVKSHDTAGALADLSAAAPGTAVVCAQNGVDNERQALRRFERAYGMLVYLSAQHLEPGAVECFSAPVHGVLDLGCVPGGVDARAEAIARDLAAAGFASRTVENVMAWKRAKLVRNLGNALDALLGGGARDAADVEERAVAEALACFEAAGLEIVPDDEAVARMRVMSKPNDAVGGGSARGRGGSSSWQSLARGSGRIEADWLNGEIVLLGRLHGVPTPVNEALQRLANRAAAAGVEPGSLTRADVDAALAGP
jgi:2-dehydropantoate 2-reductase